MALFAQSFGAPTAVATASAVVVIGALLWYFASATLRGVDREVQLALEARAPEEVT
jgi:hypothetical protein